MRALAYLGKLIRDLVAGLMKPRQRARPRISLVRNDVGDAPVARAVDAELGAVTADATPSEQYEPNSAAALPVSDAGAEDREDKSVLDEVLTDSLEPVSLNSACPADNLRRETTYGETIRDTAIPAALVLDQAALSEDALAPANADIPLLPQGTDAPEATRGLDEIRIGSPSTSEDTETMTSRGSPLDVETVADADASADGLSDLVDITSFEDEASSGNGLVAAPEVIIVTEPSRTDSVRRQPRSESTDRHLEPVTEYAIAGAPAPPSTDYRTWNRALAELLLLQPSATSDVYLTVTPRILARVLVDVQGASLNAEQAQEYFARSVADFYRARVLTHNARLRTLRRNGDDGLPECIAFLALTVLAAYRMRSDEEATGLAYYVRLAELLECDIAGQYPRGFDPVVFESLWHFLKDWLAQQHGGRLVIAADTGSRRFVGLSLAHVPLRSLDVEKLPEFFVWAGYQPSSEVPPARLATDFARWIRARGSLTPTGAAAFTDARHLAVVAQIRSELESWDGTCEESVSRRSAAVEVLFDPVQHRPDLFYVPRRPSGFPARFDDGIHAVDASDDGWYGRIPVTPQDGSELASGFTWQAQSSGVEFALRRVAASVISLAPSDDYSYSGFLSTRGLRRGVRCAVLCQDAVANSAAEYLSHVTESACTPLHHPNLPVGWSLFPQVLARRLSDAPAGLETIDVQATVGLIPSGGIRLGNRWTWLQGASPRIIVTGTEPGVAVTVDGETATVAADGMLQTEASLVTLGAHVIQVGPLRRTVEIVEPTLPTNSIPRTTPSASTRTPVVLALPAGGWTVVGAMPGEIARPKHMHRSGTIVDCGFEPSWAIRVETGRGAVALSVFAGIPPAPEFPGGLTGDSFAKRRYLAWANAIYDVAVRHPRVTSMTDSGLAALRESWKSYARCAGQIKRAFRRCFR